MLTVLESRAENVIRESRGQKSRQVRRAREEKPQGRSGVLLPRRPAPSGGTPLPVAAGHTELWGGSSERDGAPAQDTGIQKARGELRPTPEEEALGVGDTLTI